MAFQNLFDGYKRTAFDTVTKTMGYDAKWISTADGKTYEARVGFMDPSEAEKLSGIDSWDPDQPYMEYREDFFPLLKFLVDQKQEEQKVSIIGVGFFSIQEVKTKYDGDTYVARLIPTTP